MVYELSKTISEFTGHRSFSCQFDTKKDIGTCQHVRKTEDEIRCFSDIPYQIIVCHGLYTSIRRLKAVSKKKVTEVYLPDNDDRAVGGSEILLDIRTKERHKKALPEYIQTSSKCVSVDFKTIEKKLDTENLEAMNHILVTPKEKSNLELNSAKKCINQYSKKLSKRTEVDQGNVEEKRKNGEKEIDAAYAPGSPSHDTNNFQTSSKENRIKSPYQDPIDNKILREYDQMNTHELNKTKPSYERPMIGYSSSTLRRHFETLKRCLVKKEDSDSHKKNITVFNVKEPALKSIPSQKDVAISSDRLLIGYNITANVPKYSLSEAKVEQSSVSNKDETHNLKWAQADKEDIKTFGKKVNFDEKIASTIPSYGKSKKTMKQTNNSSNKKERKRFSFFKKKCKESSQGNDSYTNPKIDVNEKNTKNKCKIKDERTVKPGETVTFTKGQKIEADHMTPKILLQKYLPHKIESDKSVNIRWKNNMYATSSSTVLHTTYKDLGVILRSRSVTSTEMSSFYKSPYGKHVNFQHDIEAWMISKANPHITKDLLISIESQKQITNKNIAIVIPYYKCIDKLEAFAHNIQVILHSNDIDKINKKYSSKYLRIHIPKGYFDSSTTEGDKQSSEEVFNVIEYETNSEIQKARKIGPDKEDCDGHNVKATTSISNINERPNNLDIVNGPTYRDAGLQGSTVNITQRNDIFGVGIITQQRDIRDIVKPLSKINQSNFIDIEEEPIKINQKKCEFAESYLQDCYRNWPTLGVGCPDLLYSRSVSDSNLPSGSQKSLISLNDTGSRLYIFDDSQIVQMSCNNSDSSPCYQKENRGVFLRKLFGKRKPHIKPILENETWIVLPKDSFEVCKKRKHYAQSNKSRWHSMYDQPVSSCPSTEGKETQLADQQKHDKSIIKATPGKKCKKKKRVSMPHCEDLEEMLTKQLSDKPPDGILTFKGVPNCVDCAKKGANCPKHAVVDPNPTCIIPPPPCQVTCETKKNPPCNVPNAPSCNTQTGTLDSSKCPLTPPPCQKCSVPPTPCPASLPCNKKMKKKKRNTSLCSPPGCPIIPCDIPCFAPSPCPPSPPCIPSSSQKKLFTCSDLPPTIPCKIPPCETPPCKHSSCKVPCQTPPCKKPSPCSTPSMSTSSCENSSGQGLSSCESPPLMKPFAPCDRSTSCPSETTPPVTSLPPLTSSRPKPLSPRSYSPPVCEKPRPACMKAPPPCKKPLSSSIRSLPPCTVPLPQSMENPPEVQIPSNKNTKPCSCDKCRPKTLQRSPPKTPESSAMHTSPQSPTCLSPQITLDKCPPSPSKNQIKSPDCSSNIPAEESLCEPPGTALKPTPPKYCSTPPCSEQKKNSQNANPTSDCSESTAMQVPNPSQPKALSPVCSETKNGKCKKTCTMKPKSASEHKLENKRKREASPPKISGLFLRMKPSNKKTCAAECLSWRNAKDEICIKLDSDDRLTIRQPTNTEKSKEVMNVQVKDEDGLTLYERKDYTACGKNNHVLIDLYKDSYNRPLAVTNVTRSHSEIESADDNSENSFANVIEIQLKLRNGKSTKTKLITGNEKLNNDITSAGTDQKTPSLFVIENNPTRRRDIKEPNLKNDLNIKIVIKNKTKHEIVENRHRNDFTKTIINQSNKLQNVSTGYSDIMIALDNGRTLSLPTTTVNLSSSVEKTSTDLPTKTYVRKVSSHTKLPTEDLNVTEDKIKTVTQLKSMTKILSDNSDNSAMNPGGELANDVTYASLKPNYFRDTESMKNYYQLEGKRSFKGGDSKEDAITNNTNGASISESYANNIEFECCGCSKVAEKLNECKMNVSCCCRGNCETDNEMNCNLGNDEEMYCCNYNLEDVTVEHNSKRFSTKANSYSVILHSKEISKAKMFEDSLERLETKIPRMINPVTKVFSLYRSTLKDIDVNTKHNPVDNDNPFNDRVKRRLDTKINKTKYENAIIDGDILQSYETKKAVLKIYAEKAENGDNLVAKLPKFVHDRESEIIENCEQIVSTSYKTVFDQNIVMTCLK